MPVPPIWLAWWHDFYERLFILVRSIPFNKRFKAFDQNTVWANDNDKFRGVSRMINSFKRQMESQKPVVSNFYSLSWYSTKHMSPSMCSSKLKLFQNAIVEQKICRIKIKNSTGYIKVQTLRGARAVTERSVRSVHYSLHDPTNPSISKYTDTTTGQGYLP